MGHPRLHSIYRLLEDLILFIILLFVLDNIVTWSMCRFCITNILVHFTDIM